MTPRYLLLCAILLLGTSLAGAEDLKPITLPAPVKTGGKPLMECLAARHSTREFAATPLTPAELSNLLWAGFGINRPDGHRTAPSAMNWQEIDVYALTAEGAYKYDAQAHQLLPVSAGDHRADAGTQPFVSNAPLNLVYVADATRAGKGDAGDQQLLYSADAGFIAENVYLYCASEALAVVVRASFKTDVLTATLHLSPTQHIVLAQTIGHGK